ncbi:MAG: hypothetical protein ACJ749_08800 [Flavisolibacter sp.]
MKLSDFILLNEQDKKSALLHLGVLVGKRKNDVQRVFLFQLESYYVETFCNIDNKAIEEFRVFEDTNPLLPYLDMLSIDDLLN